MAARELPSPETLRQLLRYEPDTGKLFWREAPLHLFQDGAYSAQRRQVTWNAGNAGKEALSYYGGGKTYKHGSVQWVKVYAHRAILAMELDRWPEVVDHINGVKSDNRRVNLREVTIVQNACNIKLRSDNSSGHHGVSFRPSRKMWRARITLNGAETCLGHFAEKADAISARQAAEIALGFHANHGRVTPPP